MSANAVPLIGLGIIIIIGAIAFAGAKSSKTKKGKDLAKKASGMVNDLTNLAKNGPKQEVKKEATAVSHEGYTKSPNANVKREDLFNFMEFDKIQDNMIISKKGEKYTAIIKCKGINYNLMSEMEQLSVEEGFINFLNTLRFPIQLYVQAQNIDLKDNIRKYKSNIETLDKEYDEMNNNYNAIINSLDSTDEEIQDIENKKESLTNVIEYGEDIIRYVEKLSANKSMLQRNFYVLVSYYKSEVTNASSFKTEELLDICYSELYTRVQNILSGLSMSSVSGKSLNSNEIAELLYSAYNRDDKNFINIRQALDSGFHRLFSTSEDALMKKNKKLAQNIRKEAEYKALVALEKALDDGTAVTQAEIEDEFEEKTAKMAIDLIKQERLPQELKDKAKKEIVKEYKSGKQDRNDRNDKELAIMEVQAKILRDKLEKEENIALEDENKENKNNRGKKNIKTEDNIQEQPEKIPESSLINNDLITSEDSEEVEDDVKELKQIEDFSDVELEQKIENKEKDTIIDDLEGETNSNNDDSIV